MKVTGLAVGFSKLVLGMVTAILMLSMAGVATARYFMARLSVLPPKPLFDNELPAAPVEEPALQPPITGEAAPEAPVPAAENAGAATPDPALDPNAYEAQVVQPIGLVLREGPGTNYRQVGGVDYEEKLVVLEENAEQQWIRVRVLANGQEGWVKAGNTRRVSEGTN